MASYNELNALIDAYINRNGVQAITGQILNGVLKAMVEQLGRGYTIMGAAIPTTDPGTPDGPECYFASETGTYTDFDGLQVVPGELALLCYTPSDGWTKATIYEGFREVGATIDGNVGTPSVGVSYADGVLTFDFRNMKGNPGDAAGFGAVTATVDANVGTPGVSVQTSGPDTAKNIAFQFTNLKGETGVTSCVVTVDNTTGTPSCAVSLVGQELHLDFSGLKGAQGNTGSSVDYPFEIVNNLTTNDATKALSAAMGVQLESEVSQLEAKKINIEDSGILLQDVTTQPSTVYVTSSMVSPGDKLYFYLESINNLQGTLKCELEGYVHNSYIIVPAGQSAIVEYTIPENFLRIYTLSTYNPCKIVKVLTQKSNEELYKDVVDLKKEDAGLRSFINTEECIRTFLNASGSLVNRGWTATAEDVEPTYNNSSSGYYVTAFDTIGTSAVIVSFNALVAGYTIACYKADGTFIKNIHTSELGSLKPKDRMVNLPENCAVILIKHSGFEVSCKRNKTITENDYFTGGGRMAGVIDSIKINGIKKEEVSQYFVHTIMKKYGTSGSHGSRFLIMKGNAIQCFVQLSSVLSGVQTVNLPEFSGSGVTATIKLNMDKLAVAAQSLSGLATTPSDLDWQFSYTRTNYLYLKDAAFDSFVDNSIWTNIHPGIIDKLPILKAKLQENADDINILMLGDSFFAAQITAPILPGIANLPPNCNRKHTQYYIWDRIVKNKPQTDRWDSSVNTFTETGTFVANGATYPTLWDVASQSYHILGKNTGVDLMKYSSSANAAVAFSWDMSAYEKLHFIFAKCANLGGGTNTKGTSEATVTITQGNGKAQVWNGTEWVEANGYTFSQEITQSGDGYAKVMFYVKLKFKRVTTDTINITIANTANDGLFYYWGTERWNGNTIFITNIARGGFTSMQLQLNAINDVGGRDRDLVIFETPYTNDMASYTEVSSLNAVRWMLEGKSYDGTQQSGWLLNSCLKTLSDNFSKFDVLCVVPHIGGRFINTNDTFKVKANNITFYQMTQRYKDAITRAGLSYLGIDAYFIAQAKADGIGLYESVASGTDIFTYDDVHPNETGCVMYAKNIAPIFDLF